MLTGLRDKDREEGSFRGLGGELQRDLTESAYALRPEGQRKSCRAGGHAEGVMSELGQDAARFPWVALKGECARAWIET